MMHRKRHMLICATAHCLAAAVSTAQLAPDPDLLAAQPVPETEHEVIEDWIEQLGNPDWLMRDLATLELAELDPGISLETLEGYMRHEDLSHEQRARLRLACLRRFAMRPKGALGVSFGTIRVGAIEVQPIPPDEDFPATLILKENDQIAMVGERVIDGSFSLRVEILSRDPGSILPVTLIRNDRVMRMDLPLGSFSDLTGAVRMDSQLLVSALHQRWDRLGIDTSSGGSVGDEISAEDWAGVAFPAGAQPDAREPELIAPRGFVLGPGMNSTPDSGRWGQTIIDVWTDPGALGRDVEQRESLLAGERVQPMVALRMLLEREREQLKSDIEQASDADSPGMVRQLNLLTTQLDTITQRIEEMRAPGTSP